MAVRSVFYSWQSDTHASTNRNLIEDSLKRALRAIAKDDLLSLQPVLDRDTVGVPGSPAIADSIFSKIVVADAFVADVTIINPRARARKSPNPNVLLELGFAVATIGWDRILLVQNTFYGPPEGLPFDLRGRRIITYCADPNRGDRAESRALLQGRLESVIASALKNSSSTEVLAGKGVPVWWGIWEVESSGGSFGGRLFIWETGAAGFLFRLTVYSGSHTGAIDGFARFVSPNLANARIPNHEGSFCELSFRRSTDGWDRHIEVEELGGCHGFHGMGATFGWRLKRQHDSLFDLGLMDELDLQRLYSISGQYFEDLFKCLQQVGERENLDEFPAKVVVGAPRGLFTIQEAVVMRGKYGQLWVAYIDGEKVRYFTTEHKYRAKLPTTLEHWRERFRDKEIIYVADVERIVTDFLSSPAADAALEFFRSELAARMKEWKES